MNELTYKFSCTGCGKCCNSGPSFLLDEIVAYQDQFIMGLHMKALHVLLPNGSPVGKMTQEEANQLLEHHKKLYPLITDYRGTFALMVIPKDVGYSMAHDRCGQLNDSGLCNLYENRPQICRSVPLNPGSPVALQYMNFENFKGYGCMTSKEEDIKPIFFYKGIISDESYSKQLTDHTSKLELDREHLALLASFMKNGLPIVPDLRFVVDAGAAGKWAETEMFPLIFALVASGTMKPADAEDFVSAQVALIEKAIADAIAKKDSLGKPRTRVLKNYLVTYAKVKNGMSKIPLMKLG